MSFLVRAVKVTEVKVHTETAAAVWTRVAVAAPVAVSTITTIQVELAKEVVGIWLFTTERVVAVRTSVYTSTPALMKAEFGPTGTDGLLRLLIVVGLKITAFLLLSAARIVNVVAKLDCAVDGVKVTAVVDVATVAVLMVNI